MADKWTAEITNDPDRAYELYIELLEGDEHRAKIYRNATGELTLGVYESNSATEIPLEWLLSVAGSAKQDLVRS